MQRVHSAIPTQENAHHLFIGHGVVNIIWSSTLHEVIPSSDLLLRDWWYNARTIVQGLYPSRVNHQADQGGS